jgi:hypothetical protein
VEHELTSEIEIRATPRQVWDVLVDLERWSEWNPFVTRSEGLAEVGSRLVNRMEAPGMRAMTIRPTVTDVAPGACFEWLGHLGVPGLFDGRHRFELQATDEGTRLVQREHFSGILVRLLRRSLDDNTRRGFEAMNEALRARVEAAAPQDSPKAPGSAEAGRTGCATS